VRTVLARISASDIALPAHYHTWQAHLIEVAIVVVLVLVAGFVVRAVSRRDDAGDAGFDAAVYRCLPDDGSHAFEHEFNQLAVGAAFDHDGARYLITQLPVPVTGKWRDPLPGEFPRIVRVKRLDMQ
jgi:hypothetical protein